MRETEGEERKVRDIERGRGEEEKGKVLEVGVFLKNQNRKTVPKNCTYSKVTERTFFK